MFSFRKLTNDAQKMTVVHADQLRQTKHTDGAILQNRCRGKCHWKKILFSEGWTAHLAICWQQAWNVKQFSNHTWRPNLHGMQEIQNECNFISVQPGQIYACGKVKLNLDIQFAYQNIVQYVYVHVCVCVCIVAKETVYSFSDCIWLPPLFLWVC